MAKQTTPQPGPSTADVNTLAEKRPGTEDGTLVPEETGSDEEADLEAAPVKEEATPETDPNVVDWDGPNDPENPMNWSEKKKWLNIATLSILTLVT